MLITLPLLTRSPNLLLRRRAKSPITAQAFVDTFQDSLFDSVLQSVEIPRTRCDREPPGVSSRRSHGGVERDDALLIFEWLAAKKGVKHILKVVVDDTREPSHPDEVIEDALKEFKVEVLDWQRLDICPETICRVGQYLRDVHLHWGGNNAVLRAWSEPDGLARLQWSQRVLLHTDEVQRPTIRTNDNILRFRERLRALRPDLEIIFLSKQMRKQKPQTMEDSLTDKWFETIAEFTLSLDKIDVSDCQVSVGLIDDGVDVFHPLLRGRTFSSDISETSATGHGTAMAVTIYTVFQRADIVVFKVETQSNSASHSAADVGLKFHLRDNHKVH
ncbi:hypothetical protein BKA56DRAFT_679161 [Ilyonectria sp. MPI-CAGE-AT-0026]|nr:hypothetical protein BKA56DRAFT_679161 [Ilyonectria sp. MPI-CAGE-AT-0026]